VTQVRKDKGKGPEEPREEYLEATAAYSGSALACTSTKVKKSNGSRSKNTSVVPSDLSGRTILPTSGESNSQDVNVACMQTKPKKVPTKADANSTANLTIKIPSSMASGRPQQASVVPVATSAVSTNGFFGPSVQASNSTMPAGNTDLLTIDYDIDTNDQCQSER
jgi:hypothetical protein